MEEQSRPALAHNAKPTHDETLRLWLENHVAQLRKNNKNLSDVSRDNAIGYAEAGLRAYLKGSYGVSKEQGGIGGNVERIESAIRRYRERVEGSFRHDFKDGFVETFAWQQFLNACETAYNENVMVVVYGNPGVGKSRCLREFSSNYAKTAPIEILCSRNVTVAYFLQRIAAELKIGGRLSIPAMEDAIAASLLKRPRPLMIDQANYLTERSLGSLCHFWEKARIPVVLIGTRDLHELFTNSMVTQDIRAQVSSRVAMHYPLSTLTKKEVKTIVRQLLGDRFTDKAINEIAQATQSNFRALAMAVPRLREFYDRHRSEIEAAEDSVRHDAETQVINKAVSRMFVG